MRIQRQGSSVRSGEHEQETAARRLDPGRAARASAYGRPLARPSRIAKATVAGPNLVVRL